MQQKSRKRFLGFKVIEFELVAVNSPYYDEDTRSRQSTC